MNNKTVDLLLLFFLAILLFTGYLLSRDMLVRYPVVSPASQYVIINDNTLRGIINPVHIKPRVYGTIISEVIECESNWNNEARGKAGEIGLCQFMPKTWIYFNDLRGTNLDIYSEADQIDMIHWAFEEGLANHWTCYRNLNK